MSRFFRTSEESSSSSGSEESSDVTRTGKGAEPPLAKLLSRLDNPGASDMENTNQNRRGTHAAVVDVSGQGDMSENTHDAVSAGSSISIPHLPSTRRGVALSENASQHQGILLAALLEEHYRARAAEFLNSTDPAGKHTKDSPEVLALAKRLFAQASGTLTSAGILDVPASSDQLRETRAQYLAGLDQLGAGASPTSLLAAVRQLNIGAPSSTSSAERLVVAHPPASTRSHYQASFREICLLGRGGFGSVFKCHNLLDQKTYAVKKIPLSPHLGRSFQEGRHEDLQHLLVEVQTLASLDHANIVRYHATWVEEPHPFQHLDIHPTSRTLRPGQLLLENTRDADSWPSFSAHQDPQESCGFVFAEDSKSGSQPEQLKLLTRGNRSDAAIVADSEPSADASDIFTDGTRSLIPLAATKAGPGPAPSTTHELYIQMSLYPMTLHHYLMGTPAQHPGSPHWRHCFHVKPSIQILLSILSGLSYLWSKGLVHRDVKPRNLFLAEPEHKPSTGYCDVSCHCFGGDDDRPRWLNLRIGDFGLVTQLAHGNLPAGRAGKAGVTVGTPLYRPPSCAWDGGVDADPGAEGSDEDEKADVFALGVVFVELLCPFSTVMERAETLSGLQRGETPPCLRDRLENQGYCNSIRDRLLEVVAGMTDPDARSRWTGEMAALALCDINTNIPA